MIRCRTPSRVHLSRQQTGIKCIDDFISKVNKEVVITSETPALPVISRLDEALGFLTPESGEWKIEQVLGALIQYLHVIEEMSIEDIKRALNISFDVDVESISKALSYGNKKHETYLSFDCYMCYVVLKRKFERFNQDQIKEEKDIFVIYEMYQKGYTNLRDMFVSNILSKVYEGDKLSEEKILEYYKSTQPSIETNPNVVFSSYANRALFTNIDCINYVAKKYSYDISEAENVYDEFLNICKKERYSMQRYEPLDRRMKEKIMFDKNYYNMKKTYKPHLRGCYNGESLDSLFQEENIDLEDFVEYIKISKFFNGFKNLNAGVGVLILETIKERGDLRLCQFEEKNHYERKKYKLTEEEKEELDKIKKDPSTKRIYYSVDGKEIILSFEAVQSHLKEFGEPRCFINKDKYLSFSVRKKLRKFVYHYTTIDKLSFNKIFAKPNRKEFFDLERSVKILLFDYFKLILKFAFSFSKEDRVNIFDHYKTLNLFGQSLKSFSLRENKFEEDKLLIDLVEECGEYSPSKRNRLFYTCIYYSSFFNIFLINDDKLRHLLSENVVDVLNSPIFFQE